VCGSMARIALASGIAAVGTTWLRASEDTIGPNGINSVGLGLNGMGIAIGQVDPAAPENFLSIIPPIAAMTKLYPLAFSSRTSPGS
jgi:hypothetical protein